MPVVVIVLAFIFINLGCGPAHAQQVFKCRTDDGIAYQSLPCDGPPLKQWTAAPEPFDRHAQARLQAIERELRRANAVPARRTRRSGRPPTPATGACELARRGRSQAYAKAGLKRDFALSSHWDNQVHAACW